ncbi:ATP-binding protein [Streptomyces sp. NPDC059371]|uniref:ATP-binding protein n=1 Tax=Streptomyces sp. NPDC059371 TaxID=3346812 RepID=UPI0036832661
MDEFHEGMGSGRSGSALPVEASLAVGGESSCIGQARRLAALFLARVKNRCGIPVATATVEIVQLIVSELVTNARRYAPGPALLHLWIDGPLLHVELWDSSPVLPAAKAPDPERIGHHGLEIVRALARTLSIERTSVGKRITADVTLVAATA